MLNRYYSGLASINYSFIEGSDEVNIYGIKEYQYILYSLIEQRREDFIYKEHFKTGDILIYQNKNDKLYYLQNNKIENETVTFEDGEYAYIYIEGKDLLE